MGSTKIVLWLMLGLTLILGAILRINMLGVAPPSVNWDEASYGYDAYSLWRTGKDQFGAILPFSLRSFDDYKPALYAYVTAPIVGIFGLNEFNTRIMSAVSGVLTILMIFIWATLVTNNKKVGLISALVFTTSPSLIHYSRLAFEANLALLLLVISWIYLRKNNYVLAVLFSTISSFAYNSHKIYLIITLIWVLHKLRLNIFNKKYLLGFGLILLPFAYSTIFTPSLARFSSTSIFPLFKQSNSVYIFTGEIVNRYVACLSPVNIFVRGSNEPGLQVKSFAIFQSFFGIFYIFGLYKIFKNKVFSSLEKFWLVLIPLPTVLTWSWFNPIRVLPLWTFISLIIGYAVYLFVKKTWHKLFTYGWWAISVVWIAVMLWLYMPYSEYGKWQWGFREAISSINPVVNNYSKVVWESPHAQPFIFVLFYSKYNPETYQKELTIKGINNKPRNNFDFGKYEFRKIYWPADRSATNTLFVGGVYSLPENDLRAANKSFIDVIEPQGYVNFRIAGNE